MILNRVFLFLAICFLSKQNLHAQGCCSGGGNNPLAGGASSGVLVKGQMELAINHVYASTNKFLKGDVITNPYFEKLHANYLYARADYGLTDKLTFSGGIGYYLNKTIYEFKNETTDEVKKISSKGFADVIILPRYKVFNKSAKGITNELDLGIGFKLPIGNYNDSNFVGQSYFINNNGQQNFLDSFKIFQTSPPLVQATLGSNDLLLSLFYMRTNKNTNFNIFVNGMFIRRGWSPLGIKFGDFGFVGIFAGTNYNKFGFLAQLRAEYVGKMNTMSGIDYLAKYNIEKTSTGSRSILFSPQVSYTFKENTRLFVLGDIPIYQYLNGTQVAIPIQITTGITYRFFPNKKDAICIVPNSKDNCNAPECVLAEMSFAVSGNCEMCKDKIEKTIQADPAVFNATWDIDSHLLTISFNSKSTDVNALKQRLAEAGYDTDSHKATDKIYNALPACCKYR